MAKFFLSLGIFNRSSKADEENGARRKRAMGHASPEIHTHDDLVLLKDNKMLADKITDAHIEEFRHAFTMFDKDGDGSISTKELGTVMRSLGQNPTEKRLRAICNEVDVDGNGKLDFKEFILLMTTHFDSINAECELKTAFQVFDTKGKGWIDEAELRRCLTTIGDRLTTEEVNELLHEADGDHDGCINYLEFVKIMTQESLQVQNATPEGSIHEKSWDVTNYRKQTS